MILKLLTCICKIKEIKKQAFHYIRKQGLGVAMMKKLIIQQLFLKNARTIRICFIEIIMHQ